MVGGDQRAMSVFLQDVEQTYTHLCTRVEAAKDEEAAAAAGVGEQIQLVPENPDTTISFNVPDGPPPADLRLEGPGTEDMNVEDVRKALQMRWDLFEAFPEDMKEALKSNELVKVNKVLGGMSVEEAEAIVEKLDMSGILNFAEGGIRDETGNTQESEEAE
jgi:cell division cycle protein 37